VRVGRDPLGRRAAWPDAARAAGRARGARAGRSPRVGEAAAAAAKPAEPAEDDELERELTALEEGQDAPETEEADGDPAHAPLPEGALVEAAELHDERLGGVLLFGGRRRAALVAAAGCVAPEIVLAEMVRTARLPRDRQRRA